MKIHFFLCRTLDETKVTAKIEDVSETVLVDFSLGPFNPDPANGGSATTTTTHYLLLNKQNSFECDESLGILTPDQMTDFTIALECSRTPSCENLSGSGESRLAIIQASTSRPSDTALNSADVEQTEGFGER